MATYAIGDLQGCFATLQALLKFFLFDPARDRLWFVGDLVNRGPASLECLRFIKSLGDRAVAILGNHDLHLLAVAHGIRQAHRSDTFTNILQAPDREELLDWLRHRPLALVEQGHLLVHAGLFPQWSLEQTMTLATEVQDILRGPDWLDFLAQMYGNTPDQWNDNLQGVERWRCIINGLTRMRFCTIDGVMDFAAKEGMDGTPNGFLPWFEIPNRKSENTPVVFGHWSTLGLLMRDNIISLDTGCVWGGKLTAICLNDRRLLQVDCPQQQVP